jgi:antitoxin VapB
MTMNTVPVAKVFKNGNSQAIRIPKEFYVTERELLIQKIGNTLVLSPVHDPWQLFRKSLAEFSDDYFEEGRFQPDMQERTPLRSVE